MFSLKFRFKQSIVFPNLLSCNVFDWVFGKKYNLNLFFKNNVDGNLYFISNGVDLQQYQLRYNTNNNIQRLFECVNTYQSLLNTN